MSEQIAVGVPVYSRGRALEQFLESVPEHVATAYVAENGPSDQRDRDAYAREWPFELQVLDLEHDVGIGACRAAIADMCTEPYLWVGDSDMQIARDGDLSVLRHILDANPGLGGVSGWLIEDRAVRAGARNLHMHRGLAVKEAGDAGDTEVNPVPFVRFDFIPQAGLFRSRIYEDYSYDPAVQSSEHFDFFYGHKELGEWEFASTPVVVTIHNRNIDPDYRAERGKSHVDLDILADKWGVRDIQPGAKTDWAAVHDHGVTADAFDLLKQTTPPAVWVRLKRGFERVGIA